MRPLNALKEFDRIYALTERCEDRRDKLFQQIEHRRAGPAKTIFDVIADAVEAEYVTHPPRRTLQIIEGAPGSIRAHAPPNGHRTAASRA